MAKHTAFLSGILLAAVGCQEAVTAPGACPGFCKDASFEVIDSVLQNVVVRDSSFTGFVFSHRSGVVQLVGQAVGVQSRGILNFVSFQPRVPTFPGDTVFGAITEIDSFVVQLSIIRRNAGGQGVTVGLHRLAAGLDSTITYAVLDQFFVDSTLVDSIAVPDSLLTGDITRTLGSDAFQSTVSDTLSVSLGVEISSLEPAFLTLGASTSGLASIRRFFKVDSSGTVIERNDSRIATFASSVASPLPALAAGELSVGGLPSSRSIIRMEGIEEILSGGSVIRATLEFTPSVPVIGATGDSVVIQVNPVGADLGKKSPVILTQLDTLSRGLVTVPTGSTESFELDLTTIVRAWALNSTLPRMVILTSRPEGATIGEVRFSSSSGAQPPLLRLTFVPPIGLKN